MTKNEIVKQVFCRECNLKNLNLKECIFAYQSAEKFSNDFGEELNNLKLEMLKYMEDIKKEIISKINKLDVIYVIQYKYTRLPYMEQNEGFRLWVFDDKESARKCVNYYKSKNLELEIISVLKSEYHRFLKDMNYFGFNKILVNNGLCYIELDFEDFVELEKSSVINRTFMKAYLDFIQSYKQNLSSQSVITAKENKLLNSLLSAQFLLPVTFEGEIINHTVQKDAELHFPLLINSNEENIQPVFTDWKEFRKWDKDCKYKGFLVNFESLYGIFKKNQKTKMSINPFSIDFILNENNFKLLEERKIKNGRK